MRMCHLWAHKYKKVLLYTGIYFIFSNEKFVLVIYKLTVSLLNDI